MRALVQDALFDRLTAALPDVRVQWPRAPFTPLRGEVYMRPTLIPADEITENIGGLHYRTQVGFMQVDVFGPGSDPGPGGKFGTARVDAVVDRVKAAFRPGGFAAGGINFTIVRRVDRADRGSLEKAQVPVEVRYRASRME